MIKSECIVLDSQDFRKVNNKFYLNISKTEWHKANLVIAVDRKKTYILKSKYSMRGETIPREYEIYKR